MIGKISIGASFRGCIEYCLEDKKLTGSQDVGFKNRAEIIACSHCFGNKKELIEQFNDVRALNQKVQKPVMHFVLSLAPGEQLEKGKLAEIVAECAKEMGFDQNQYLAVSHIDTNHQHLHIVANRVGYDGKVVSDSNNYKKIAGYCRKIELKYELKRVLSPRKYLADEQKNIPRLDVRKEKLRNNIRDGLKGSRSYGGFESSLKQMGYEIVKGRGILFIDKQGVKVKGSEVGYPLQKIEKILVLQTELRELKENRMRQDELKNGGQYKTVQEYNKHLQEKQYLADKESVLTKTIDILLTPKAGDYQIDHEFQKQSLEKKKKRRLHL